MTAGTVALGLVRRHWIEMRRYSFNTVASFASIYIIFLFIFLGANAFLSAGPGKGRTLSEVVVGYFVWVVGIAAFGDSAEDLSKEASEGTLEQVAMTPLGLTAVVLLRFATGIAFTLATLIALLLAMMATTGHWLHLDLVSLLPLMALAAMGVQGVGMMVAGCALVFKRVQSFQQIVQFAFIGLVAVPIERFPFMKLLPLAWSAHLIERVGIDAVPLWRLPLGDLAFLVAHSAAWLAAGTLAFRAMTRVARDRALLGHH